MKKLILRSFLFLALIHFLQDGYSQNYITYSSFELKSREYLLLIDSAKSYLYVGDTGLCFQLLIKDNYTNDTLYAKNCFQEEKLIPTYGITYIPKSYKLEKKDATYKFIKQSFSEKLLYYTKINEKFYFCVFSTLSKTKEEKRSKKMLLVRVLAINENEKKVIPSYVQMFPNKTYIQLVPFPYVGEFIIISKWKTSKRVFRVAVTCKN